jgi:hypothetical protein
MILVEEVTLEIMLSLRCFLFKNSKLRKEKQGLVVSSSHEPEPFIRPLASLENRLRK